MGDKILDKFWTFVWATAFVVCVVVVILFVFLAFRQGFDEMLCDNTCQLERREQALTECLGRGWVLEECDVLLNDGDLRDSE